MTIEFALTVALVILILAIIDYYFTDHNDDDFLP